MADQSTRPPPFAAPQEPYVLATRSDKIGLLIYYALVLIVVSAVAHHVLARPGHDPHSDDVDRRPPPSLDAGRVERADGGGPDAVDAGASVRGSDDADGVSKGAEG